MPHLLLIDDDPALILTQLRLAFPAPSYRIETAHTGAEGIGRICAGRPDVILLDVRLPDQSGLEVYQEIRRLDLRIPVIFVTVVKTADETIEAMRQGAYDYLFKPLDLHQLRRVVGEALEVGRRMYQQAVLSATDSIPNKHDAIIGSCPAMREVYKAIGRVADQNVPLLITGESGTGKGTDRPRHLSARPSGQGFVPGPQLRGHPGAATRKRDVRPREGRLHRGQP